MVAYLLDSHTEPERTFAAQLEPKAARKTELEEGYNHETRLT